MKINKKYGQVLKTIMEDPLRGKANTVYAFKGEIVEIISTIFKSKRSLVTVNGYLFFVSDDEIKINEAEKENDNI
ncbi:MAG: hypothetical protein ACXW2E_00580 [Nitrososphaeraceae archaeon]